jgi:outer membrane protein OmpA-like peptidoglycan-associated protein
MKCKAVPIITASLAAVLSACATGPERSVPELDSARATVAQIEASPRAGIAATNISEARKAVNRANELLLNGESDDDIRFQAELATRNAQIANEKISTAQANDEIAKGTAERQQVLLEARAREAEVAHQRAQGLEDELQGLRAQRTERGLVLTLGDVLFDTGKATLKPGAYATLDRVAAALHDSPDRKVVIEGHTDGVGSEELNQTLSQQRATAVQSALMQRGVSGAQITAMGKGETMPVASNDDAAGRQRNRRVELILSEGGSRVASDGH